MGDGIGSKISCFTTGILALIFLILFFYDRFIKKAQSYTNKAFELTKKFGDAKLECVCVEDIQHGSKYLVYYLLEEDAQFDSSKKIEKVYCNIFNKPKDKWKIEKRVHMILDQMPYEKIFINYTDKSTEEFMSYREKDKIRKRDQANKEKDRGDIEAIKDLLIDKDVRIVCHKTNSNHSEDKLCIYILYVDSKDEKAKTKYFSLFEYPEEEKERGDRRARNYLAMLEKETIIEDSPISYNDFNGKIEWIWEMKKEE